VRILVVDDDPAIIEILRIGLQREGYLVLTASTGEEAVRIAQQEAIACAIIDIKLPGMDGIDVVRYLRGHLHLTCPLVLLTAHVAYDAEMQPGLQAGASAYVLKPFRLLELRQFIHQLVSREDR
jgi:two-component system, response regulator, stage 0 sporulation protein F